MGFIQPDLPVVDHDEWSRLPRQERIRPMTQHFGTHGFGSPDVVVLGYVIKLVVFVTVGWAFILSTPGIDGWFAVGDWWRNYTVFYKFALFTMLWEVLGLGCGFGPLNLRFIPPMGSALYWLRPGTIRLPPFGGRIPGTAGDTRTPLDVVLYAAFLVATVVALWGAMTRAEVAVVVVLLVLVGLRDQVIFLAARAEVYGSFAIAFLFAAADQLTGAKAVMLMIWWGAAVSKINRHFPSVLAAMQSNNPFLRFGRIKERFHRGWPDDMRPGPLAAALAHSATVVELVVPTILVFSAGGTLTTVCAFIMIAFHLGIISSVPMGVPLEWNVTMIAGVVFLFLAHPGIAWSTLVAPWLIALLVVVLLAGIVAGNVRPDRVSFLIGMRYYAGNWAASLWCFRNAEALDVLDANTVTATMLPHKQLEKIYGSPQEAQIPLHMGYAFRGFHSHGKALWSLIPEVVGPDHESYTVMDGELIAGMVLGWNFGDGHLHDEKLAAALQKRCGFAPGDVRVIFVESEPFGKGTQAWRLFDVATGPLGSGWCDVDDLVNGQPWSDDIPLHRDTVAP